MGTVRPKYCHGGRTGTRAAGLLNRDRDHHQRRLRFQALPQGGTSRRPGNSRPGPVGKTIYSLKDLREILLSCNRRYLEYLSSLDDFSAGIRALGRLTQPRPLKGRNLKGPQRFLSAQEFRVKRLKFYASATVL